MHGEQLKLLGCSNNMSSSLLKSLCMSPLLIASVIRAPKRSGCSLPSGARKVTVYLRMRTNSPHSSFTSFTFALSELR